MPWSKQPAAMSADEFRILLEAAGMTQGAAAVLLGVNVRAVSRWLSGETPISAEKAAVIRERLQPS